MAGENKGKNMGKAEKRTHSYLWMKEVFEVLLLFKKFFNYIDKKSILEKSCFVIIYFYVEIYNVAYIYYRKKRLFLLQS